MVEVEPIDRDSLRFFWVKDPLRANPVVMTYRFTRMVFGVNCSSFLLNATLKHHLNQYKEEDSEFVGQMLDLLYVNDLSNRAEDEEAAYLLYLKAKTRFGEAVASTSEFLSNSPELMERIQTKEGSSKVKNSKHLPEDDQTCANGSLGCNNVAGNIRKILGVKWRKESDRQEFDLNALTRDSTVQPTKSSVMGMAVRVAPFGGMTIPGWSKCQHYCWQGC